MDLDCIITSWNAGAARLYGYTAEEIIGRSTDLLATPESPDGPQELGIVMRRGELATDFETTRRHKDGRSVPVSISGGPILDATGTVVGGASIAATSPSASAPRRRRCGRTRRRWSWRSSRGAGTGGGGPQRGQRGALAHELEPEKLYAIILDRTAHLLPCDYAQVRLYQDGWAVLVATWESPAFLLAPGFSRW